MLLFPLSLPHTQRVFVGVNYFDNCWTGTTLSVAGTSCEFPFGPCEVRTTVPPAMREWDAQHLCLHFISHATPPINQPKQIYETSFYLFTPPSDDYYFFRFVRMDC